MPTKRIIIFDFDGTIADTVPHIFEAASELAVAHGLKHLTREDFEMLRGMTPGQIISYFKIPLYKIPALVREGQQKLKKHMTDVSYIKGMPETLVQLITDGYTLGILTSNSTENVEKFLHDNKLVPFHFIHSQKNLFGKDHALKQVMKKYAIRVQDAVYVGDEVRDVEACLKIGLDVVSVTWGFNSRNVLSKLNKGFIIDRPEELPGVLSSL